VSRSSHRITRHPSGLVIATARVPHLASISLGLWVGTGGRYEPAALNGAAHFIEHMLFKGTTRRSPLQLSQAIEGIGGYLNAFTSEEHTCFYSKALHDRLPDLLDVLMDMFLNSRFASSDIALEREVIKEEAAMCFDDPLQHVQELINETLWPDHPLGRPLTGTSKTLDAIQRRHLLSFKRRHYVASNTVLAAAGNLDHDQVVAAAASYVRRLPATLPPPFLPLVGTQTRPRVRLFTKDVAQTQMALGVRTCPRQDDRRFALRLLNTVLGENMSSRLFQELRENRGLAYHVQSSVSFFHDAGTLDISAGLDTTNLRPALRLILRELGRLIRAPLSGAELARARDFLLGQMTLSLENSENVMNLLGEQWLGFGRLIPPEAIRRRLAAVTASEIQSVARDFFRPDRLNLAVVSPLRSGQALEPLLQRVP
jgi:predicted Zn-dependent peptidase